MRVSKEFLLEAVGLSLLVALILISMQLFQRATKLTTLLEEGQTQRITELEEYEIVKYDGLLVDGITAVGYIKKMVGTYGLKVTVATTNGNFLIEEANEYLELRNVTSDKYVNPLAKYRCEVVRDENEVITEIRICVEKEGD